MDIHNLTRKENEVLNLIVKGLGDKEIAKSLFVSVPTVRTHITSIFTKMDVNNRKELIIKILSNYHQY